MNCLFNVRNILSVYNTARNTASRFKAAVSFYGRMNPYLSYSDCIEGLKQDLPVEMFWGKEPIWLLTTLHQILRDCLLLKGFQYNMAFGSYRSNRGLTNGFLTEEEDKQQVVSCLNSPCDPFQATTLLPQILFYSSKMLSSNSLILLTKKTQWIIFRSDLKKKD